MSEILATMTPRPARRWIGTGIQVFLGGLLIVTALEMPAGNLVWQLVLAGAGGLALWGAVRLHNATAARIEMTMDEITDSHGNLIARLDEVQAVDKGAFAFKPTNGFLLRTATRGRATWYPGLWWRLGRFVGVGGVTPRHEGKLMAEMIQARITGDGS